MMPLGAQKMIYPPYHSILLPTFEYMTKALFGCIKFTDVKFTGEFFQNFTNPFFPKVYIAEPIYCLPDEVFALFNACQGTACMMHARLHAACKFACPPCKLYGTRWKWCKQNLLKCKLYRKMSGNRKKNYYRTDHEYRKIPSPKNVQETYKSSNT